MEFSHCHVVDNVCLFSPLLAVTVFIKCVSSRGVTIHFFHKRYVSRYLICITIHFIGNCNYSLKSMLVDMGAAMFFLYEVAYVLAEIINI